MNSNSELTEYMNGAVERLIKSALKTAWRNPKETAFIMEYRSVLKKAAGKRTKSEEEGLHIPAFLISSISNSCNLFCKGCYARENKICGETAGKALLSAKKWSEIFEEAEALGIVFNLLAGGEPFLRKDVLLEASKIKNMIFPIFTNGLMIDEEYLKLLDRRRNLIPVISLEGSKKATDDRRGTGTYDKINDVMDRLKELNILYGASITVTTQNMNEVTDPEFIKRLSDKGCRLIFFIEYVPIAPGTEGLAPSEEDRDYMALQQEKLRKLREDMIFLSFPGDEKFLGGCLAAGRGFFHINPYGGAEPCPFSPYSDRSLTECSLTEALQSPLFQKLNAAALVGGEHSGGCALFEHRSEIEAITGLN
jgi:MoaA/NifB/PqqE/SkfB family radical SAM enzyme